MKQKEILSNTRLKDTTVSLRKLSPEEIGDEHFSSGIDTPLKKDAFEMSDKEKIKKIEFHFTEIMETLGLDLTNDSLKGTQPRCENVR